MPGDSSLDRAMGAKEWTSGGSRSKAERMKAIGVRSFGGPKVLQLTNISDPHPGPDWAMFDSRRGVFRCLDERNSAKELHELYPEQRNE